jgi:cellobiose transport system substrate-binding protein
VQIKTFVRRSRRRLTAVAAVVVGIAAVSVTGYVAGTAQGSSRDTITLHVGLFGDFGYHDLYQKFEAAHPNIDIKEDVESYPDHHSNLAKHLAVGAGAADVESIEVGFIAQFKSQPRLFYDLKKYGAGKLSKRWLGWKWRQSVAPNGAQIGLGTDVGSLAICYRRDLFKKAGLPTNRDAVSKLWPTWQKYIAAGQRFEQHAPKGVSFFDSGSNVYNAMIGQLNPAYYASNGNVIVGSNAKVKQAWQLTMKGIQLHESAGLAAFSNDWNTGYKKGKFATVTCPAWMMGYIQGQAPKTKGKWDIAAVPGGGGNWGGSFLAVPRQSSHPKEAYQLAEFLTSPSSEQYVFKQTGNLPSQPALLKSKGIQTFKNRFFSNAPVGKIFSTSALKLKPQMTGPHQGDIQTAVSNAIQRVEQRKQSPSKSWKQFLKDVQNVA